MPRTARSLATIAVNQSGSRGLLTISCHTACVSTDAPKHSFQDDGVFMLAAVAAALALEAGFFGFDFFGAWGSGQHPGHTAQQYAVQP